MWQLVKLKFLSLLVPKKYFFVSGSKSEKVLYLTFDDGPVANITDELLALLKQHNAFATFFVLGKCVENEPDLTKSIVAHGHVIGNHSYNHRNMKKMTKAQQIEEIVQTNVSIKRVTGGDCNLFRAPQGRWNFALVRQVVKMSMTCVHWNRDSLDFKKETVDTLVARFKSQPVRPGDVILFHDDNRLCIDALSQLIPFWQQQGFELKGLGKER